MGGGKRSKVCKRTGNMVSCGGLLADNRLGLSKNADPNVSIPDLHSQNAGGAARGAAFEQLSL